MLSYYYSTQVGSSSFLTALLGGSDRSFRLATKATYCTSPNRDEPGIVCAFWLTFLHRTSIRIFSFCSQALLLAASPFFSQLSSFLIVLQQTHPSGLYVPRRSPTRLDYSNHVGVCACGWIRWWLDHLCRFHFQTGQLRPFGG